MTVDQRRGVQFGRTVNPTPNGWWLRAPSAHIISFRRPWGAAFGVCAKSREENANEWRVVCFAYAQMHTYARAHNFVERTTSDHLFGAFVRMNAANK